MRVFDRLNYTPYSGSNVTEYSDSVKKQLNSIPTLLQPWQQEDMANSDVNGYFKNPVNTIVTNIWNSANTIIAIPNLGSTNVSSILTAAWALYTAANNFYGHTNRLSGLADAPDSDPTLPTYKTALGVGKMVSYLVFQTDGVENNSPIIGNFSSLYTNSDLTTLYNNIQSYATSVQNSIITVSDNGMPPTITYTSNLTQQQATNMVANLTSISTFFDTRRTADVDFYYNSKSVVDDYNTLKSFNNMGQTQTDMVTNLIGSDKLVTRLSS